MSWSRGRTRIIKATEASPNLLQGFSFGRIFEDSHHSDPNPGVSGFIPLVFGSDAVVEGPDPTISNAETPEESPPNLEGMIVLSEEEFQARLDEVYRNGMEEGRRQAERGLANVFKSLREGVAALTGLRNRVLKESEEDLLKLAIMIARRIVQQEIAQDPSILASIIGAAISACSDRDRVVVHLNPEDYAMVAADRQKFLSGLGEETPITLTPDEGVGPGGCLVETVTGTVDARIESQLDEIYRSLLEERSVSVESQSPSQPESDHRPELPLPTPEDVITTFSGKGAWIKGDEDKSNVVSQD